VWVRGSSTRAARSTPRCLRLGLERRGRVSPAEQQAAAGGAAFRPQSGSGRAGRGRESGPRAVAHLLYIPLIWRVEGDTEP